MKKAVFAISGVVVAGVIAALWWRKESERRSLPCPSSLSWVLENPLMDAIAGTGRTLERIGVRSGERVLDVGSGPGRLALPAAERVGPQGQVTAVDLQPAMLARLQRRAREAGVSNIETRLMDIGARGDLEPESYDRAWLATVLGEISEKEAALRHIYRALKPGGTLSISELLPDPHYQRLSAVLQMAQSAGFQPTQHWGNFLAYTQNFIRPS